MRPPRPPRWAEWLLTRLLGRHPSTPYLIGDLREEHAEIARRFGPLAAVWYPVVALTLGIRLALGRLGVPGAHQLASPRTRHPGDLMRNGLTLAFRSLTRRPVVSGAVILTIGSALAAATIAFATVNGVLLRSLPYANPDRLVVIWERSLVRDAERNVASPANFLTWRDELRQVESLAAVFETSGSLTGTERPEQVGTVLATGDFFPLIGATPVAGRLFGPDDAIRGAAPVTVMSERYWRTRYGADPGVIGRSVLINGNRAEIIGVLPERLEFAPAMSWAGVGTRDFYLPWAIGEEGRTAGGRFLQVIGRLAPGASLVGARQEASKLAGQLRQRFPERQEGWDVNLVSLHDDMVGDVRFPIAIVFGAVCFVLLIAGANVANLLMARATERRGEMAIRSALGAGRMALARQLFGESLLLATLGGILGAALSIWGVASLVAASPDLPRLDAIRIDAPVIGFLLLASTVVATLVGVGPAIEATGRSPGQWFGQRGAVSDRRGTRARRMLVGVQVALSVILLVGAGVLVRSLVNRLGVDLGIDAESVVTGRVSLPEAGYPTPERREVAFESLVERAEAVPGVEAAAVASIIPMSDGSQATGFQALDRPTPEAGQFPVADVRFVHHRYFAAMGIPIQAGRSLSDADRAGSPVVVVINETGARQLWPNESPIGKRILMEWGDTLRAEIVGVARDVRLSGPDRSVERATLYWDYRQTGVPSGMTLVVRGRSAEPAVEPIRAALAAIDPDLPLYNVRSMDGLRDAAVAQSRFITAALGLFSLLALGLAVLGVYGVMAYGVEQRTREIGVRLALGADRASVVRMLLRDGGRVVLPALAVGLGAAWVLTGFLRTLAFGVAPRDPVSLAGSLVVIGAAALAACWIPARRASAIPAVEAIRAD